MDIISYNKAASAQRDLDERVLTNVPNNAVFTDTTYSKVSEFENDSGYLTYASIPQVSAMMKKGPDIPENADLNTYNENGFYHQNYINGAKSGSNYPNSKAGMLVVMVDGSMVYQMYHSYDGTGVFHRAKYTTTWHSWERLYDSADNLPRYKLVSDDGTVLSVPSSWDAAGSTGFYSGSNLVGQTPFKSHTWQYTLTSPHTNEQYAYQLAKGFNTADGLSYRTKYNGDWDSEWHRVWDDQNMGSGSGLDADKLDGAQLSEITHSGSNVSLTGDVTGSTTVTPTGNIVVNTQVGDDSHQHSFDNLKNKHLGTGHYGTSGKFRAGVGSGEVAITTNDGGGNANVTFNHTDTRPDQDGNSGRITVNVDDPGNASMSFQVGSGVTSGVGTQLASPLIVKEGSINVEGDAIIDGDITVSGTVDGRDLAADGDKLDSFSLGYFKSNTLRYDRSYNLPNGTDLDTITVGGFYDGNNLVNAPDGVTSWLYLIVQRHTNTNGFCMQQAYGLDSSAGTSRVYQRLQISGTWGGWVLQYNSANDGSGSGLDADKLDGLQGSQFLRTDANDIFTGLLTGHKINLGGTAIQPGSGASLQVKGFTRTGSIFLHDGNTPEVLSASTELARDNGTLRWDGDKVWTEGNDGVDSGLDADKLDGQEGSYYATKASVDDKSELRVVDVREIEGNTDASSSYVVAPSDLKGKRVESFFTSGLPGTNWRSTITTKGWDGETYSAWQLIGPANNTTNADNDYYLQSGVGSTWNTAVKVWHSGNDGSGSDLDADKLDGQEGSYYLNASNISTGTISDARLPSTISSSVTGNSATATKLKTPRTVSIGNTQKTFDGSSNLTFSQSDIGYTPADVIAKIKTVDGSGSGLDADTLDGFDSTEFVKTSFGKVSNLSMGKYFTFSDYDDGIDEHNGIRGYVRDGVINLVPESESPHTDLGIVINGSKVWHSSNDGAGSGLDADKLDGLNSSDFVRLRTDASNSIGDSSWITNYESSGNVDHVWYDETLNRFNFCADTTYKATANAKVAAGSFEEGGTTLSNKYLGKNAVAVNSNKLGGKSPSNTGTDSPDTIAVRDANADISARLFRSTYGSTGAISPSASLVFRNSSSGINDNYLRFCSEPSAIRGWLDTYSKSQVDAAITPSVTKKTVFTASGNFVKDPNSKFVLVRCWGAGGGGAVNTSYGRCGGGSGGAYSERLFLASELNASEQVVVGAGGLGGNSSSRQGSHGNDTRFKGFEVLAHGGNGGKNTHDEIAWGGGLPGYAPSIGNRTGYVTLSSQYDVNANAINSLSAPLYTGGRGGNGYVQELGWLPLAGGGGSSVYGGAGGASPWRTEIAGAKSLYGGDGGTAGDESTPHPERHGKPRGGGGAGYSGAISGLADRGDLAGNGGRGEVEILEW